MREEIEVTLQKRFGHDQFRPGQKPVIEHLLAGRSAAAVFPTGGGKSICYQLPALLLPGVTLVVSPLIALMKDQIDGLLEQDIAARRLDSTLSGVAYREVMQSLRSGELKLLFVAPERFNNERFREAIRSVRISLFAVDEAHCISEWGHNFRPDYLKLAGFAQEIGAERILALTATATPTVLEDICRNLKISPQCAIRTGFYRPNLHLLTTTVAANERDRVLLDALKMHPPAATIIYVTKQQTAEEVAQQITDAGLSARPYHAGMKDEIRSEVQEWFMASASAIVVATIAFGMGVDKADIRYLYHYNPPKSLENYAQEIGRAGRDGERSICHLLFCPDDLNTLENFIYGDTPELHSLQGLLNELLTHDENFDLALYQLSSRHNIRPLVLKTLLTYLELDGFLAGGTPFYSEYKFKPKQSSQEILQHFQGERREFVTALFRSATQARVWFSIDLDATAKRLLCSRERIVTAMDWLGEQRMLEVRVSGVRHRYQRLKIPQNINQLASALQQRMVKREEAEMGRLQQVVEIAETTQCRSNLLSSHFGEPLDAPCGHCSSCLGEVDQTPERQLATIPPNLSDQLAPLLKEKSAILDSPRTIARFLCGIGSPQFSRARLGSHTLFGRLEAVPLAEVERWVQQ